MTSLKHIYEVYALRYATQPERSSTKNFIHHDFHETTESFDFFIWVIRNQNHTIIVDTGFSHEVAIKRSREFLSCPKNLLTEIGIEADNVSDVVLTHMHYDHSGNLGLFPNAQFHIQEKEMNYCTGHSMTYSFLRMPFEVDNIVNAVRTLFHNKLSFHNGMAEIVPDVTLHLIGEHTPGLQVVRVPTKEAG